MPARSQDRGSLSPPATIYWRGQEATAEQRKCSNHKATNQQDMQGWTRENHEHPFETRFMETTFHFQGPFLSHLQWYNISFLRTIRVTFIFYKSLYISLHNVLVNFTHCLGTLGSKAVLASQKIKGTGFAKVTWRKFVHCRIISPKWRQFYLKEEMILTRGSKRTATNSCTIFAPGQSCHSFFRPKLPQSFRLEL